MLSVKSYVSQTHTASIYCYKSPPQQSGTHDNFLMSDYWRRKQQNVYSWNIEAFVGAFRSWVKVLMYYVISKSGSECHCWIAPLQDFPISHSQTLCFNRRANSALWLSAFERACALRQSEWSKKLPCFAFWNDVAWYHCLALLPQAASYGCHS